MQSYVVELFKNISDIVIIKKDDMIVDANESFFNFFTNFKNIDDIKGKRLQICRFFKQEKGFIFHNDDMKWIEFVLKYPNHSHKAKIIKAKSAYIFKLEVLESQNKEFIILLKNYTETQAYKENGIKISEELDFTKQLLKEYDKAINTSAIVSKNDLEGKITFANREFIELTEYSESEIIGKAHTLLKHNDVPLAVLNDLWETVQSKGVWKGILKNSTKHGSVFYTNTTVVPILDKQQNILEYISIQQDITNLIEAQNISKEAIKSKNVFLSNMAHEIKIVLENISLYCEQLLMSTHLNAEDMQQIKIVADNNEKMVNLINSIYDYAKINRGDIEFLKEKVNIKDIINEVVEKYQSNLRQKNIAINTTIDDNIPLLKSDKKRLQEIFSNLIDNAIKFSKSNSSIEIEATVTLAFIGGCRILFVVKDYGIGIDKSNHAKIFKPFIHVEHTIIENYKGTGLGLALSKSIISAMGGNLDIESSLGTGSKFFFELNFEVENEKIKTEVKETTKDISSSNEGFKGRLLVVDDNQVNRRLMEILIKKRGLAFELANDGKEALAKATSSKFDIVLMDINMPIMGGIESMQKIKAYERENNLPSSIFISLSANVSKSDTDRYLESGFDDCLPKPLRESELDIKLERYLHSKKTLNSTKTVVKEETVVEENPFEIRAKELELDVNFLRDLIKMFFDEIYEEQPRFRFAIDTIDFKSIKYHAHKIKGSALNLKLDLIAFIAADIEVCARKRLLIDYNSKFNKLEKVIAKTKSEFNKI